MRYIVVGRHKFTSVQVRLLEKAGLTDEVGRIAQVEDPVDVIKRARELGADAIVVQALPMHLLAQLLQAATRAGIPVYGFKIQPVAMVGIDEECPAEADVEIPNPRAGNKRCNKTVALERLIRVLIETQPVVTVEEL